MFKIIEYLGQNPKRSLAHFLRGLGLFALGVALVTLGYYFHHYWQVAGIVFLALGCTSAAWGYLGMFANRLWQVRYHLHKPK